MIRQLNYYDFRDLSLRLAYYPENYTITFFCTEEEDRNFFIKLIKSITKIEPKVSIKGNTFFENKHTRIKIMHTPFAGCQFLGCRSNAIITDIDQNSDFFREVILPMCNIGPTQIVYTYNKDTLLDFEEYHEKIQKLWEEEKF